MSSRRKRRKEEKERRPDDERPDIQLTTFRKLGADWAAGTPNLEKDRRMPTPEVRTKAEELTKGLNSDLEKTEALYDYVAKNFRYVSLSLGVGRYQPHAAADVLQDQYGDCKDKHTLLASLLEAEGLHASSVLINSTPQTGSRCSFALAVRSRDHDAAAGQGQEVWMDTTSRGRSFSPARLYPAQKAGAGDSSREVPALLRIWRTLPRDTPMPDSEHSEDYWQDQRHREA